MGWINNYRYESIFENLEVRNGKFICAWFPVYGLIKVDGMVLKISNHEGYLSSNKNTVIIEYIREKTYTDGLHGTELSEKEIYEILTKCE